MTTQNNIEMEFEEDIPEPEPNVTGNQMTQTERSSASGRPPKPKKIFAKRAVVWQHFTQLQNNKAKSNCRYCGLEMSCDSKSVGTSPMISHIGRCKSYKSFLESGNQTVLSGDSSRNMKAFRYDKENFRRSTNELIVMNELPFSFAESEGWKHFCFNVLPMYKTFSRKTCTRDIAAMYLKEKTALKILFSVDKKRVSLTTDIWVSPTTSYNYMVVTAHWIDENWQMQKRVISFKPITDHKGATISGQLIDCLEEWGIKKVFTVTVDNAKGNDKALELFTEALKLRDTDALVQGGALLHIRCCAHILNLIVRDGLAKVNSSIEAIRNAVKYVRSSFTRLKSFELRCETGKISRGSLALDCKTQWNSTYLMLVAALKLRVAFEKMMWEDKLYCDYFLEQDEKEKVKRVGPPTTSDWDEVERLVKFLKIFFTCTLAFSVSKSVASTLCYNEIVTIERYLITKSGSSVQEIRMQANVMRDKFDKYWDGLLNMNQLMIIASVFDPRNKMQFALLCFEMLYGKYTVEYKQLYNSVTSCMKKLFAEYSLRLSTEDHSEAAGNNSDHGDSEQTSAMFDLSDDDDGYERMDSLYSQMVSERRGEEGSTELEIYLAEKTEARGDNNWA